MTRCGGFFLMLSLLFAADCQREVRPLSLKGDLGAAPADSAQISDVRRTRVAFLVDVSQSLMLLDPFDLPGSPSVRQQTAAEVVQRLAGEDAAFSFILLRDVPQINAGLKGGFVSDPKIIEESLATLSQGAEWSDWQSSIDAARQMIQQDLNSCSQEELARSTYDVILVVDGLPFFVCEGGCAGGDGGPCEPDQCVPCDAGLCPSEEARKQPEICYTPRVDWCIGACSKKEGYPALRYCEPYNTSGSLDRLAAEIAELSETARIRVHVVMLPIQSRVLKDQIRT